ncbi:MAG: flagellar hook-basal body complex protein, partial [Alphaproteobacteria bacterium]|nr:flagellar hook-basal body complex protein [Alphaproteobacteria bacterium]
MSLYGALFSGVSGLSAQSSALSAIADNVTNVNTIGYKETSIDFQTLVTKNTSNTQYTPGGVESKTQSNVASQGLLQATSSATDVGISGDGFFVVNNNNPHPQPGDMMSYSRAGSFTVDNQGFLQTSSGGYLQGWPLMTWDGNAAASKVTVGNNTYMLAYKSTSSTSTQSTVYVNNDIVDRNDLQPLNLNNLGGTAQQTTSISVGANLPSNVKAGTTFQTNLQTVDTLGQTSNMQMDWTNLNSNNWGLSISPPPSASDITLEDASSPPRIYGASGRLDITSSPAAGDTIQIAGTKYQFVKGPAGLPINNGSLALPDDVVQVSIDTPTTSTSDITSRLTAAIQLNQSGIPTTDVLGNAKNFSNIGAFAMGAANLVYPNGHPVTSPANLNVPINNGIIITGSNGGIATINFPDSTNPSNVAALINQETGTTNISATVDASGYLHLINNDSTDLATDATITNLPAPAHPANAVALDTVTALGFGSVASPVVNSPNTTFTIPFETTAGVPNDQQALSAIPLATLKSETPNIQITVGSGTSAVTTTIPFVAPPASTNGLDSNGILAAINAQTPTTGVKASLLNGQIAFTNLNTNANPVTISDGPAASPNGNDLSVLATLGFGLPGVATTVQLQQGATGAGRFSSNGNELLMEQAPGAGPIEVNTQQANTQGSAEFPSWTPQSAVNPTDPLNHGIYTVQALDPTLSPAPPALPGPAISFNGNGTPSAINVANIAMTLC